MVDSAGTFSFAKTPEIVFGDGKIVTLGKLISVFGNQAALITGGTSYENSSIQGKVEKSLNDNSIKYLRYSVVSEPSPGIVDSAVSLFKSRGVDCIVAVGGGSVMDAGKAIAAMIKEESSVKDYLEGVGTKTPSGNTLPFIAIPTTSGTGSETTKNAVISELGPDGYKKSLRHNNYVPDTAIIDPELTMNCPADITASSGMDAFTQLLESYMSVKANPMSDALAFSGLTFIANSLMKVYKNGKDAQARAGMAYAAMLSGITLSNAGLGVIHGFAQPLGSLFPIPHGVVCSGLMGIVNRMTVDKLRKTGSGRNCLLKYAQVGRLFVPSEGKDEDYYIDAFLDIIDQYIDDMYIPRLGQYGVKKENMNSIIQQTSLKNHPVDLNNEELSEILSKRL